VVKYESPMGLPNRAYFPPNTVAALHDPSIPLLMTEGEKKAASADQEGFPCVGLTGVYGWHVKRERDKDGKPTGDRKLIPDLAAVAWQGRPVFLTFDTDPTPNANVNWALWHLSQCLIRLGAVVKIVRLPQGEPGLDGKPAKVGLDDFIVKHGPDALRMLLAEAVASAPPPAPLQPLEADDDPHRLARICVRERCTHADGLTLRNWRDECHRWAFPDGPLQLPDLGLLEF
jgi:putative DNA primase/helicase